MSGTHVNGNPLLAANMAGLPYKSVPALRQNARPSQTSLGTVATVQYTSKAPPAHDLQKPPARPRSPTAHREGGRGRDAGRGGGAENHSIAAYLQIPPTINNSKGSLADFAAQITCLFWFESSVILHRVEESHSPPMPTTSLLSDAMPTMGFRKWVTTILSTTQVTQNVILLALMFIYRLKRLNPTVKGKLGSEFRLLTVALMLGNKFLDDNTYTNKTWAEVSGISVQEIHIMEVEFLSNMRYTLYASEDEWRAWHVKLGKFWNYFDMASNTVQSAKPKSINLPAPAFHHRPDLPTPPASVQPSPAIMQTSPSTAPYPSSMAATHLNFHAYAHPLSAPPFLPPTMVPPFAHLPEGEARSYSRKRSYDDASQEPPPKRFSSTPSANSVATLTPSTMKELSPPLPRLPLPNLSISTGDNHDHYHGGAAAQLPMPQGRSMATVFPGPNRWPQNGMLPSVQTGYLPGMNAISPMNEWSSRRSPYPPRSTTPSPTSLNFPSQSTPSQQSPSGYLYSRSSPYRPVRGVNTLLVPPPSGSMHNPPQNLGFDQMYYQPLGKPMSEQRAGVLPYMHHDGWAPNHQMSHLLPQPRLS
jgi:hypothetical protein